MDELNTYDVKYNRSDGIYYTTKINAASAEEAEDKCRQKHPGVNVTDVKVGNPIPNVYDNDGVGKRAWKEVHKERGDIT